MVMMASGCTAVLEEASVGVRYAGVELLVSWGVGDIIFSSSAVEVDRAITTGVQPDTNRDAQAPRVIR